MIYGIEDDKKYFNEIFSIVKKYDYQKKIIFKKPIFNENIKFRLMSESSYNIIMSKSNIKFINIRIFKLRN